MKKALITGITGQDGSYLAELLCEKNYEVHGTIRRQSDHDHKNIKHIKNNCIFHQLDLTDYNSITRCIELIKPQEIYNLAAQSHVKLSFDLPINTADINSLGPLRILEAIKQLKLDIKFYQASTSELFGTTDQFPQNENTYFMPASPYGISKLFAHWSVINYRSSYNMFACNGILFNHESPRRGELFVTKKITSGFAKMFLDIKNNRVHYPIHLGNLDSLRDWGHAKDYVEAMWLMLQQNEPNDYVISSERQYSIRQFCNLTADFFGLKLEWIGDGLNEHAVDKQTGKLIVVVDPAFYRPVDVVNLIGDSTKAHTDLNWSPKYNIVDLVNEMCSYDLKEKEKEYV
jgi:GDPmannose 4,6-dehydratase